MLNLRFSESHCGQADPSEFRSAFGGAAEVVGRAASVRRSLMSLIGHCARNDQTPHTKTIRARTAILNAEGVWFGLVAPEKTPNRYKAADPACPPHVCFWGAKQNRYAQSEIFRV